MYSGTIKHIFSDLNYFIIIRITLKAIRYIDKHLAETRVFNAVIVFNEYIVESHEIPNDFAAYVILTQEFDHVKKVE